MYQVRFDEIVRRLGFRSGAEMARELGRSRQAASHWRQDGFPANIQLQIFDLASNRGVELKLEELGRATLKKAPSSSSASGHEAAPIKIRRPQFVYQDGKPAFAVVPIDDWERIIDALDDLEDMFFLENYQADPNAEYLPAEIVDALLGGDNPIRVWREHRGLSQQQLAEEAGISKPYLSQLEAGRREASQRVIRRLAKALQVDFDDLIHRAPEDETAKSRTAASAGRRR